MNKIVIVCMVLMALVIPVSAANNIASIGTFAINAGETIRVPLWLNNSDNIMSVVVNLVYDPSVLQAYATTSPGPDDGDFIGGFAADNTQNSTGFNQFAGFTFSGPKNGNVIIGYVHLRAVGNPGDISTINVQLVSVMQPGITGLPSPTTGSAVDGLFTINPNPPVPEVPTMVLVAAGMIGLIGIGRLRKK